MKILEFLKYLKTEHNVNFYGENGYLFNTSTKFISNLPRFFLENAEIVEIAFSDIGLRINVKFEESKESENPELPDSLKIFERKEYWQPCKIESPFYSVAQQEGFNGYFNGYFNE